MSHWGRRGAIAEKKSWVIPQNVKNFKERVGPLRKRVSGEPSAKPIFRR